MGAQQLSEILTKLDSWLDAYQLYAQAHPAIVQVWALETSKNSDLDGLVEGMKQRESPLAAKHMESALTAEKGSYDEALEYIFKVVDGLLVVTQDMETYHSQKNQILTFTRRSDILGQEVPIGTEFFPQCLMPEDTGVQVSVYIPGLANKQEEYQHTEELLGESFQNSGVEYLGYVIGIKAQTPKEMVTTLKKLFRDPRIISLYGNAKE